MFQSKFRIVYNNTIMGKIPLTIVTAVLNEEKLLPHFLKHVKSIADEVIVVVDYRTTDKSAEIARKNKCQVVLDDGSSKDIVFNNKNLGIKAAKNDWVMIVDADERLDSRLQREVRSIVLGKSRRKANIYQTSFINYEFGKLFEKCDQKQKPFVRLFKKGAFLYQTKNTAEGFGIQTQSLAKQDKLGKILLKIPKVRTWYLNRGGKVVTLKGHLIHFSHPTIIEFLRKINLYSTREAKILYANNPSISETKLGFKLIFDPLKEFVYKYFIWRMYKEGTHGFIVSLIYAFYRFLIDAKYFRLVYRKKHLAEIKRLMKKYSFDDSI